MIENYYSSVKKWEGIVEILESNKGKKISSSKSIIRGKCGYCSEFYYCSNCPLSPDYCSHYPSSCLFWDLDAILSNPSVLVTDALIQKAKEMLAEVKKHEKAFEDCYKDLARVIYTDGPIYKDHETLIKDTIRVIQQSNDDYKDLKNRNKELEARNKELEAERRL